MTDVATAKTYHKLKLFGFDTLSPGAYKLDLSNIATYPLVQDGNPRPFLDVLRELCKHKIVEIPVRYGIGALYQDEYITDSGKVVISIPEEAKSDGSSWCVLQTFKKFVELSADGIDVDHVSWFFFESDVSRDADVMYHFFITDGERILRESTSFMDKEPMILAKVEPGDEPVWRSQKYFDEAWQAYWYRKFYTETLTGKLMVLRSDEPRLYSYQRQPTRDITRDIAVVTLIKAYRLLWAVVVLIAAVAFPSLGIYFGIVAAILLAEVLWRAWVFRKISDD